MNTITANPSNKDFQDIKQQIKEAKRSAEYQKLQEELQDAAKTPTEFDGAMQYPDTEQALKTKRKQRHFIELLITRVKHMFSLRPIMGNIIALIIAGIALFFIFNEVNLAGFAKYQGYFSIGIQFFAAIQIIKSATRGLLLPFLALAIGAIAAHSIGGGEMLFHFNRLFYQHLMITGIIGLGVATLTID